MKKIVLGCASVLLSLSLFAACDDDIDEEVRKDGEEENGGEVVEEVKEYEATGVKGVLGAAITTGEGEDAVTTYYYWTGSEDGSMTSSYSDGITITEMKEKDSTSNLRYLEVTIDSATKYLGSKSDDTAALELHGNAYAVTWSETNTRYETTVDTTYLGVTVTTEGEVTTATLSWTNEGTVAKIFDSDPEATSDEGTTEGTTTEETTDTTGETTTD